MSHEYPAGHEQARWEEAEEAGASAKGDRDAAWGCAQREGDPRPAKHLRERRGVRRRPRLGGDADGG